MRIQLFNELYRTELLELRDAEKQLVRILPRMARAAHSPALRQLFNTHAHETEIHVGRLENILARLNARTLRRKSRAMTGLLAETRALLRQDGSDKGLIDASLIVAAQKVEAHEIACYACLHVQARFLGYHGDLPALEKSFEDEKRMEESLRRLAQNFQVEVEEEFEVPSVPMTELAV